PDARKARPRNLAGNAMGNISLDDAFPVGRKAVIHDRGGGGQASCRFLAQIFRRAQLDLDFALIYDGSVSTVKRPKCAGIGRAEEHQHRDKADDAAPVRHGVGRNTQMAGGSPPEARTATKSRSSSGTKNPVRAPETVGIFAIRS